MSKKRKRPEKLPFHKITSEYSGIDGASCHAPFITFAMYIDTFPCYNHTWARDCTGNGINYYENYIITITFQADYLFSFPPILRLLVVVLQRV